ncbi:hypothetical protein E1A91_D03G190800v1 [Gossypium mustelinum]|uniref:RING-type domain-containing protein n=1 Tax=Gossypium mustelinum TaxID=34275 RepID=A0A5D2VPJ3_GOSMU|nr:hypothetical protein E1A91_D03G190800v1 [Gossypium mustelinum]
MAVQAAQYPSNVFLLSRNGQDGQQGGGVFVDQSHMFFNNGSNGTNNNTNININNNINQRKRGRELVTGTAAITTPMNSFTLQTPPPQMIDLSQLHHHHQPNVVVSTGLRLSSGDQQQSQNHGYLQQQQQPSSAFLSIISENLGIQIKRQREELDQFLQAQGEELRRTLAEKRQRHYHALLGAAEEIVARRLREKEAEVEKAKRRNAELEARAAQVSVEVQVWQAKARAQEATAVSLQAQLQQAIMSGATAHDNRKGDEELNCAGGGVERQAEDAESAYVDPDRVVASGPVCRACRKRAAAVVLLPCQHLCLCTECDRVAQACPLCLTARNSSVEVLLS